jgi:hypothetical protein
MNHNGKPAPGNGSRDGFKNQNHVSYPPSLDIIHVLKDPEARRCVMAWAFGRGERQGDLWVFSQPNGGTLTLLPSGIIYNSVQGKRTYLVVVIATLVLKLPNGRGPNFGKVCGFVTAALRAKDWPGLKDPSNYRQSGGVR